MPNNHPHKNWVEVVIGNDILSSDAIIFLWDWLESTGCNLICIDNLGFDNKDESKWRVHGGFKEWSDDSFYVDGATRVEALVRAVISVREKQIKEATDH